MASSPMLSMSALVARFAVTWCAAAPPSVAERPAGICGEDDGRGPPRSLALPTPLPKVLPATVTALLATAVLVAVVAEGVTAGEMKVLPADTPAGITGLSAAAVLVAAAAAEVAAGGTKLGDAS